MGGETPMDASMTLATFTVTTTALKGGPAYQCNQRCEWLTWYSIKALHEFTSHHVCRSRDGK